MDHHTQSRSRGYRHRDTTHSHSRTRSRSRSPDRRRRDHDHHHDRHHRHKHDDRKRHRHCHSHSHSHGKSRHGDKHGHDHGHDRLASPAVPASLPFQARQLSKRDLSVYEPVLAMYLDIQKGLWIEDLTEEEIKGRWKSFVGRWNRGELAEGWYDPSILEKARRGAQDQGQGQSQGPKRPPPPPDRRRDDDENEDEVEDEDEDEDYGPDLPQQYGSRSGPTIPTTQDLDFRKESTMEDNLVARQEARDRRRAELRSHKSEMRHVEDEVAPKAEPGTHERRMQKRQDAATANRAFAESRRGGSPGEGAPDEELMGSGENDLAELKKVQEKEQRKKNDREIRREEILRARTAEREERVRQYREKEDETIGWLKTLAKQRFG